MQSTENANNPESDQVKKMEDNSGIKTPDLNNDTSIQAEEESLPNLEQSLRDVELEAARHREAWMRAKAETENIRKRTQIDVSNAHKYAIENFSSELLTVMDSLEAALKVDNVSLESFRDGMELTHKQLIGAFEKFGITVIDPQGEKFDPHQHQAMCIVDSEFAPNTVVQVIQKGYKLHERVIRPALVSVSKAQDT